MPKDDYCGVMKPFEHRETLNLNKKEEYIFTLLLKIIEEKCSPTVKADPSIIWQENNYNTNIYLCGGFVRDNLLNINSSDIDIAISNMSGLDFANIVVEYLKENNLNFKFPVIIKANPDKSKHLETAILEIEGLSIDFVNLRKETYTDSRVPTIEFGTIEEDAQRRDLTINALFYNLRTKLIEDYVGGLKDLYNGIARTPIDTIKTFTDDPLRIYRCVRFAVKYNLIVDENIIWATKNLKVIKALETKVSSERVAKEIFGYLLSDGTWKNGCFSINGICSANALELLEKMDLLHILFEDCLINFHKAFYYLINIIDSEHTLISTLAIILRENPSSQITEVLLKIKCPKNIIERVNGIISATKFLRLNCDTDRNIREFMRMAKEDLHLSVAILEIDFNGNENFEKSGGIFDKIFKFEDEQGGYRIKSPLTGQNLLDAGFESGPIIGKCLKALDDKLLENPNMTKEEALNWLVLIKS